MARKASKMCEGVTAPELWNNTVATPTSGQSSTS